MDRPCRPGFVIGHLPRPAGGLGVGQKPVSCYNINPRAGVAEERPRRAVGGRGGERDAGRVAECQRPAAVAEALARGVVHGGAAAALPGDEGGAVAPGAVAVDEGGGHRLAGKRVGGIEHHAEHPEALHPPARREGRVVAPGDAKEREGECRNGEA